jgi:methionyl-tRNA synthetase
MSLANAIDPVALAVRYGLDALRYFLLREIPFGGDGDFSEARLKERYEGELGNELGNLVSRVFAMAEKYLGGTVPMPSQAPFELSWASYISLIDALRLSDALGEVMSCVKSANKFIDERKPWVLAKQGDREELQATLYALLETLRQVAFMLYPFIPETGEKILQGLGLESHQALASPFQEMSRWGGLSEGQKVNQIPLLFPRI